MQEVLPAVELHFDYISKDKRRRCYILLDNEPQQALQVNKAPHTHTHPRTFECEDLKDSFNILLKSSLPSALIIMFQMWGHPPHTTIAALLVHIEQPRLSARYDFFYTGS